MRTLSFFALVLTTAACQTGSDASTCVFDSQSDGAMLITCPDGSTATVPAGAPGGKGRDGTDGGTPPQGSITGEVMIMNRAEMALYQDVTEITGNLSIILAPGFHELSLPNLERIQGDLFITSWEDGITLSLSVERQTDDTPVTLDFPKLTALEGRLDIGSVTKLSDLDGFSALRSVDDVSVSYNDDLEDISGLYGLTSAGDLSFRRNDALCDSLVNTLKDKLTLLGWAEAFTTDNKSC